MSKKKTRGYTDKGYTQTTNGLLKWADAQLMRGQVWARHLVDWATRAGSGERKTDWQGFYRYCSDRGCYAVPERTTLWRTWNDLQAAGYIARPKADIVQKDGKCRRRAVFQVARWYQGVLKVFPWLSKATGAATVSPGKTSNLQPPVQPKRAVVVVDEKNRRNSSVESVEQRDARLRRMGFLPKQAQQGL